MANETEANRCSGGGSGSGRGSGTGASAGGGAGDVPCTYSRLKNALWPLCNPVGGFADSRYLSAKHLTKKSLFATNRFCVADS